MPSNALYHYAIVRDDLSHGQIAAQLVHAIGESVDGKVPDGTRSVVLMVNNEDELLCIDYELIVHGIPHVLIVEEEGELAGQATTIGVSPMVRTQPLFDVLRDLSLYV